MTEQEKDRNARRQARMWNREVDRLERKLRERGHPVPLYPASDDDFDALREARRCAGWWNQIVNNMNGYI